MDYRTIRNGPVFALDFLLGVSDPRVTFSGGANGTRTDASGALVAATTPRLDYDPVTLLAKGLLIEEARTNLFLNSLLNGANLTTQDVTVTAQSYTISFYGTGSITLSGAAVATINGSGVYPTRTTYTFTPAAGPLTCTVAGSVQYAQIEAGAFATSFIPTAGAGVTRSADVALVGTAPFAAFWNGSMGTLLAEWSGGVSGKSVVNVGTTAIGSIRLTPSSPNTLVDKAGTGTQITCSGLTGSVNKMALAYDLAGMAASLNGGITGTTATTMSASTQMGLGMNINSTNFLNGWLRKVAFYPSRLADATLQGLTT